VKEGGSGKAVLSFKIGDEEHRFTAELAPAAAEDETTATVLGAVPTLWARRRIRELEESPEWMGRHGSQQGGRKAKKIEKKNEELEAQLVELGQAFGLVSAATSYVLIDEREDAERAGTQARYVRVPGQLTKGWQGGMRQAPIGGFMDVGFNALQCLQSPARFMQTVNLVGGEDLTQAIMGSPAGEQVSARARTAPQAKEPPKSENPFDQLAMSLGADGFWEHQPAVFEVTGLTKKQARSWPRIWASLGPRNSWPPWPSSSASSSTTRRSPPSGIRCSRRLGSGWSARSRVRHHRLERTGKRGCAACWEPRSCIPEQLGRFTGPLPGGGGPR